MLWPQIPELIEHASSLGICVAMTTNGTLIDETKAKQLVAAGLRGVNISIDSPTRKMHERIRGVEGAFKATTRAVELFRRCKNKGKLTIRINTVVSRTNYTTLESFPDLAHELGADGINLIPVDDHCGEILSMLRKDIALFNAEIAHRIAERALTEAIEVLLGDKEVGQTYGRPARETSLASFTPGSELKANLND